MYGALGLKPSRKAKTGAQGAKKAGCSQGRGEKKLVQLIIVVMSSFELGVDLQVSTRGGQPRQKKTDHKIRERGHLGRLSLERTKQKREKTGPTERN